MKLPAAFGCILALLIVFLCNNAFGQQNTLVQCNFDTDKTLCKDWKPLGFTRNNPGDPKGPNIRNDHTNPKSSQGRFMYIRHDPKSPSVSTTGSMNKILTLPQPNLICFQVWYWQTTSNYARLNISAFRNMSFVNFKAVTGNQGRRWKLAQVTIRPYRNNNTYNLWIKAQVVNGIIAIDDLQVTSGPCPRAPMNGLNCQFERGDNLCGMKNITGAQPISYWRRWAGVNTSWPAQINDHTLGTPRGHFYGLDFGRNQSALSKPQFAQTMVFNRTQQACVTFWYMMYKQTPNSYLKITMSQSNPFDPSYNLFRVQGAQGINWHQHRFQVYPDQGWQLIFEAKGENIGIIGIDDLKVEYDKECPLFGRCDFESLNNTCLWDQVKPKTITDLPDQLKSDILWTKWKPNNPKDNPSYPKNDTTTGTRFGTYLIMRETGAKPGQKAVLQSPRFVVRTPGNSAATNSCLSFSYFIPRINPTTIRVYQMEETMAWSQPKLLRTLSYSTMGRWAKIYIDVAPVNINTQIMWFYIQGQNGQKSVNFAAIDDIAVDPNKCPINPGMFQCRSSGKLIPIRKKCDFRKDCDDNSDELACGNCSFEMDECGFSQTNTDYSWKRVTGSSLGGPPTGAKKTPSYELSIGHSDWNVNVNHKADLVTPSIGQGFAGCGLSFYYNTKGNFSLKVLLLTNRMEETEVWNKAVDARRFNGIEGVWRQATIRLGRIRMPFKVIFRSIVAYRQDLTFYNAIDEISLVGCQPAQPSQMCTANKFRCKNGVCIDPVKKCDFTDDCGDNSDEGKNCTFTKKLQCSFEKGFCFYNTTGVDKRVSGFNISAGRVNITNGPTRDHTKGLRSGKFLYIAARTQPFLNPDQFPTRVGVLKSPVFAQTNKKNCSVTFYLQVEGPAAGQASLQIAVINANNPNQKQVLKTWTPKKTYSFERITHTFWTNKYDFQWVMTGNVKNAPLAKMYAYVAIDDIAYTNDCVRAATYVRSSSNAGAIVAAVLCPLIVLAALGAAGYWYYFRYRPTQGGISHVRMGRDGADGTGNEQKPESLRSNPLYSSIRRVQLDQSTIEQDKEKRLAELEKQTTQ